MDAPISAMSTILVLWAFRHASDGPRFGRSHEAPVQTTDDDEHDGDDCDLSRHER